MAKAHKATNQEQFLLRRKLTVEGLTDDQWDDVIQELNHHPCVDFAEGKPEGKLVVTFDGTHWSTDALIDVIEARGGNLKGGWWRAENLHGTGSVMKTSGQMPTSILSAVQKSHQ
nr:hypothetical protein [Marinobacter sp. AC-23]